MVSCNNYLGKKRSFNYIDVWMMEMFFFLCNLLHDIRVNTCRVINSNCDFKYIIYQEFLNDKRLHNNILSFLCDDCEYQMYKSILYEMQFQFILVYQRYQVRSVQE